MSVLITGGTGFIGTALALECLRNGQTVTALGRENPGQVELENIERIRDAGGQVGAQPISSLSRLREAMLGVDTVFHLAAAQHEMDVPDSVFRAVNVEGTRNVLEAALSSGVKRIVHGSTIGVYSRSEPDEVDEETPLNPENIYGITKAEGEAIVRSYMDRLDCVIVRISETYGPGDRRLLKLFRGVKRKSFPILGNGRNLHQLIYIDDLVRGVRLAAERDEAIGATILLAGDERLSTVEMVDVVAGAVDGARRKPNLPLTPFLIAAVILEKTLRPLGIQPPLHRRRMDFFTKSFCIDNSRASKLLGFSPEIGFTEGARRTCQWYVDNKLL